jgi:hypothetical protein
LRGGAPRLLQRATTRTLAGNPLATSQDQRTQPSWLFSVVSFLLISPFAIAIGGGFHATLTAFVSAGAPKALSQFLPAAGLFLIGMSLNIGLTGVLFLLIFLTAVLHRAGMSLLVSYRKRLFASRWAAVPATAVFAAISALIMLRLVPLIPILPSWTGALMEPLRIAVPVGAALTAAVTLMWWYGLPANNQLQTDAQTQAPRR